MVSSAEYLELFTALGMSPFDGAVFDPFRHEITEVEQSDDPDEPIRITEGSSSPTHGACPVRRRAAGRWSEGPFAGRDR
ncbi:hypothetical protein ACIOHO_13255 [Streptomyces sp. NPDC087849]|uniref:hypothetical protein n=1 Tax=Streptomyces sp. NPDC087849 TaxID=3365808 RepID=UPI0037FB30D2